MKTEERTVHRERAYLVGVLGPGGAEAGEDPTEEIRALAETAGAVIVGGTVQKLRTPNAKYYIGSGKVEEILEAATELRADLVIFDIDLSPAQVRNLEQAFRRRVVDRTELILDIFATHARTAQAKLQVELAQLEYEMPRLRRMWTHLGQQAGGAGAAGVLGIGVRGPGEKQIEVDRRLARDRVSSLKRDLGRVAARKEREVAARVADHYAVSLVGYTNAGKSTLMNRLTAAGVYVDDRLFSTLDTRTRLWKLPDGVKVLLSDTVGFIRRLPHTLVSSFHATLEEVSQADLILHVVDAAQPEVEARLRAVGDVLAEIGCGEKESLLVFNKVDRLPDALERRVLESRYPGCLTLSAATGEGIDALEERVSRFLAGRLVEMELTLPAGDGKRLAELYEAGVVLERRYDTDVVRVRVRAPRSMAERLRAGNAGVGRSASGQPH